MHHSNHFAALFINGQGIEVIHFNHFIRTDWMRHWASIFSKLRASNDAHISNSVDGS
ncbi:Uncharacterised protein [Vibrio cholerae]|nr:Uncharacterised protein [Vibrio cholerae]CSI30041.1 Uncharacterised protein [Vibrio cholerae]